MKDFELKNVDPEDIEDILIKVEKSFNIEFKNNELAYIDTFGEMCDHIKNKIQLDTIDNCTTQQAFYKLKNALLKAGIDSNLITPDTLLIDILPRKERRTKVKEIEEYLCIKLRILRPPYFINNIFLLLFIGSFIMFFFNWIYALSGISFAIIGLTISERMGKEINLKTLGELAEKITRENYLDSRRDSKTHNDKEIEKILVDLFSFYLHLDKSKLIREARFG